VDARTGEPNAVELTVEQAWFVADVIGAGSFPWVLAITPPYRDHGERAAFVAAQTDSLVRMRIMRGDGPAGVNSVVAQCIRTVCFPERWLELRFVGPRSGTVDLRGIVARAGRSTVVALRSAQFVTFTAMELDHPHALAPVLTVGLAGGAPAVFDEFTLPATAGAKADEQIRKGTPVAEVLQYLGLTPSGREVAEAVYTGPRSYVEVIAGQRRDGVHVTTEVGMSVVDCPAGRILVRPHRGFDGTWLSTFTSGTSFAISLAVEQLTATLPDGRWFPETTLTRDFDTVRPAY
jgi:hypothetical protein